MAKIAVIGAGFAGLSAAAYLSAGGHEVHVYEKNGDPGGRARQLKTAEGYIFDMGPSWYWMPDVYERFFNDFGYTVSDLYKLELLDPAFEIVFGKNDTVTVPGSFSEVCFLFETIEKGAGKRLVQFMEEARFKYEVSMSGMVYKPGLSLLEFADMKLLRQASRLQMFSSLSRHVRKYFSHPKLIALLEFPALFLGAMPQEIPAMYSLMNFAALGLGTWYPVGGFGSVVDAIKTIAEINGAHLHFNSTVEKLEIEDGRIRKVIVNSEGIDHDAVIAAADYHHVENRLIPELTRNYGEGYWEKRTMAPSCLIYFVGINKRISSIQHHTLFFDEDLILHSREIYKTPQWPSKPLFYVCCPSRTDNSLAPAGHENLFFLMPLAPGLEDDEAMREKYFKIMLNRFEEQAGEKIETSIVFRKSYCIEDFISDYHSYKGNAYGLANTLAQTAILKPKIRNKKISNLFYAGQLTVPGPGVPPALISGKLAAGELLKYLEKEKYEAAV